MSFYVAKVLGNSPECVHNCLLYTCIIDYINKSIPILIFLFISYRKFNDLTSFAVSLNLDKVIDLTQSHIASHGLQYST